MRKLPEIQLKKPPAQINQSLQSGLELLLHLALSEEPVSLSRIAEELDMDYTRINRLFGTLAAMGFAERTSDRRYIAGPGIHILAALGMHKSHILATALPHLNKLIEELSMPVVLGVLWERQVCYIFRGGPNIELAHALETHTLYEAEHSSIGLAIMAQMSDEEILRKYAEYPQEERQLIQEKIKFAREQKFARGGKTLPSLAVPLGNPAIAGLAVAPGSYDFDEAKIVAALRKTGELITRDINTRQ